MRNFCPLCPEFPCLSWQYHHKHRFLVQLPFSDHWYTTKIFDISLKKSQSAVIEIRRRKFGPCEPRAFLSKTHMSHLHFLKFKKNKFFHHLEIVLSSDCNILIVAFKEAWAKSANFGKRPSNGNTFCM